MARIDKFSPPSDWTKANFDSLSKGIPRLVAIGGVMGGFRYSHLVSILFILWRLWLLFM